MMINLLKKAKFLMFIVGFIVFLLVFLFVCGIINYQDFFIVDTHCLKHDNVISVFSHEIVAHKDSFDQVFERYLKVKLENEDKWMTFMTILSTLFAVFFVYSGFKIDKTVEEVKNARNLVNKFENQMKDLSEYSIQLQYCMSFIIQKQYQKAIDSLEVLRKENFVWKDSNKRNTCNFFLAHCYYECFNLKNNIDDIINAVQYIGDAFEDDSDNPFKEEILHAFNEFNSQNIKSKN